MFFKPLYNSNMRQSQRTSTFQHQTNFGTGRSGCGLRISVNRQDSGKESNKSGSNSAALEQQRQTRQFDSFKNDRSHGDPPCECLEQFAVVTMIA
jgi:hypothetical protein